MAKAAIEKIPLVEYEILKYVLREIPLDFLREQMCPKGDEVSQTRFRKGAENVSVLISNLVERRRHLLPLNHSEYKEKGE
tara:strand:+ start:9065 stop:9304 length:240 start_codon:yes stop_codon:yes gene_type:complete